MAKLTENEEARLQQILTTLNNYYAKYNIIMCLGLKIFKKILISN